MYGQHPKGPEGWSNSKARHLYVQPEGHFRLATFGIQPCSPFDVASQCVVAGCSQKVLWVCVTTHKAHIGVHLAVHLCHLKGLLVLLGHEQELNSSL